MIERTHDPETIETLLSRARKQRPWQIMMVGEWDEAHFVSKATKRTLEEILNLCPNVPAITLRGPHGYARVSRDFPDGNEACVNKLIARIFRDDPHVTAIELPGHTATPSEPYWSSTGRASAAIAAARDAGVITAEEAIQKLEDLRRNDADKGTSDVRAETGEIERQPSGLGQNKKRSNGE
ncbi:hypothetical protein [Jiella mangrovi]|uniref:Uncharacterized protein n=1 Tax=Jiella mangrovi TaxID=2821407 RepID=A0ABS4BM50_9HYPH|nr:hypothetical protein [Jiella mangrovi]MBP0617803.1 hypothetical protein [Jiella mangrovi]